MTPITQVNRLAVTDWRTVSAERMAKLYAVETERWVSALDWDTSRSWDAVETGRQLGTVSGLIVESPSGEAAGWCFYLVHGTSLQIGGFVAESESAAQRILDALFEEPSLAHVDTVTLFAFADAPGLAGALRARGLAVDRYWYLRRELTLPAAVRMPDIRSWREDDIEATADLLARAYSGSDASRPFAPRGTPGEWREYVEQLAHGTACGAPIGAASFAIPAGPGRLVGVALTTRIAPTTGHLVQLAVDPRVQSTGIGANLLELTCGAALQAGCRQMTLLVSGRNARARALYEDFRFQSVASFLAAGTFQPRRSTSVAPGVTASTRR